MNSEVPNGKELKVPNKISNKEQKQIILKNNCMTVKIGDKIYEALVDSGAGISAMPKHILTLLPINLNTTLKPPKYTRAILANQDQCTFIGIIQLPVDIQGCIYEIPFHVLDTEQNSTLLILGLEFLSMHCRKWDFGTNVLTLNETKQNIYKLSIEKPLTLCLSLIHI